MCASPKTHVYNNYYYNVQSEEMANIFENIHAQMKSKLDALSFPKHNRISPSHTRCLILKIISGDTMEFIHKGRYQQNGCFVRNLVSKTNFGRKSHSALFHSMFLEIVIEFRNRIQY